MKELKTILDEIDRTCDENLEENIKIQILTNLWNLYNSKKNEYSNIMNNEIYIIDQNPTEEKVDLNRVKQAVSNLKESRNNCISREDAITLLK